MNNNPLRTEKYMGGERTYQIPRRPFLLQGQKNKNKIMIKEIYLKTSFQDSIECMHNIILTILTMVMIKIPTLSQIQNSAKIKIKYQPITLTTPSPALVNPYHQPPPQKHLLNISASIILTTRKLYSRKHVPIHVIPTTGGIFCDMQNKFLLNHKTQACFQSADWVLKL